MSGAIAGAQPHDEHQLSWALRIHEAVLLWWQGLGASLARGLEGSQARSLMAVQIGLCGADTIFLQVALDSAGAAPRMEDASRAKTALSETREIEAKARSWLEFASQTVSPPADHELARRMAEYQTGHTEDLGQVVQRMKARQA
jgi:hypothetical protein